LSSHPGLAIVNVLRQQSLPGTAAEAAAWASANGLVNVHVWADTTDYFIGAFTNYPPINLTYPNTIVLDVDTMTIDFVAATGISGGSAAIQAILDAEHLCADY